MARTGQPVPKKSKGAKKTEKGSKRKPEEEEEEVAGDMPEVDEGAAERAAARKAKKQKKKAAAPEPESEPEEEAAEEEDEEEAKLSAEEKARRKLRRQREHKKVSGYRSKAKECGFSTNNGVAAAAGVDSFASALTSADAKRLMRFVPEVLNKSSYEKAECAERMALSVESVPGSAARESQARCESALRWVMNQAVLRTVEKGAMRVDAATMSSVLRPFQYNTTFTSVSPPKGLIRHAQTQGKLKATTADEEGMDVEKTENKEMVAAAKKLDAQEVARKAAFAARKKEMADARATKA